MLVIRKEQLRALAEAQDRRFEEELLGLLMGHFPGRCPFLGGPAVRAVIRSGLVYVNERGGAARRDVARFIVLMFAIGVDFGPNPVPHWVAEAAGAGALTRERVAEIERRVMTGSRDKSFNNSIK